MLYNLHYDMLCAPQIIFGKISQLEMLFRLFGVLKCAPYKLSNLPHFFLGGALFITIACDECFVNLSNRAVKEPSINQRSSLWSIHLQVGVHDKSALWQI